MVKNLLNLVVVMMCLSTYMVTAQSTTPPYRMGYTINNNTRHEDKTNGRGTNNTVAPSTWKQEEIDANAFYSGFKFDILYARNTFNSTLFASKGYYANYVELRWDIAANSDNIIQFKVYRKLYGSSGDSLEVATIGSNDRVWRDEYTELGVMYEYTLVAMGISNFFQREYYTYVKGMGFRIAGATITGRVTYQGGTAVPGVQVIAESEESFPTNSVYFSGDNSFVSISENLVTRKFNFEEQFSFQTWIRPHQSNPAPIMTRGSQYQVLYEPGQVSFKVGAEELILPFEEKVDTFFHVSAIYRNNKAYLYVFYHDFLSWVDSMDIVVAPVIDDSPIYIARNNEATEFFKGYIHEVRFYNIGLSDQRVRKNYGIRIPSSELNISAFLPFNEGFGEFVFDFSRQGLTFHENHGRARNIQWSTKAPTLNQLSYKGITDQNGNYVISSLPYATTGTMYQVIPMMDNHQFDPQQNLLFVGPTSSSHNNINFMDISSFIVRGNVVYRDTYFPVQDCQFYVDDVILTNNAGTPLRTDAFGNYEIEVPIGHHYIEVRKHGHGFESSGRFPVSGTHDFQQPLNGVNYVDTTLIKMIGKVAGGPIEAEKPKGLGKTNNNLGNATIVLTTQKGHDLTRDGVQSSWENRALIGGVNTLLGETDYSIPVLNPRDITINPDPETGEFVAYLLPEIYTVKNVSAGNYVYGDGFHVTIDLSSKFDAIQEIDTLITDDETRIDSVFYQHNQDFIYRETPSINVTKVNGEPVFWETTLETDSDGLIAIVDGNGAPLTNYPIFKQRQRYDLKISVFENYINSDRSNEEDNVPVRDGRLDIVNNLAIQTSLQSLDIQENGEALYSFTGGLPNITQGGLGDYLKTFSMVARTGPNGVISTPWLPHNGSTFTAYVFGGMPTGNNFITKGPSDMLMILRDPPGTNSSATLESGSSFAQSYTLNNTFETEDGASAKFDLGAKIITFAGVGAGVITENETVANTTIGLSINSSIVGEKTTSREVETTKSWSTSDDMEYVGAQGDLFVGSSVNIVYGISTQINLIPTNSGEDFVGLSINHNGNTYDIGKSKTIRISPEFDTEFMFTQNHIKNAILSNLRNLAKNVILSNPQVYQCVICDPSSDDFARPNETGQATLSGYTGGDSYNIVIPQGWDPNEMYTDSVDFYNKEITGWEYWLKENEKEKVQAVLSQNLSFDAGAIYQNSVSVTSQEESVSEFSFNITGSVASETGFEVMGIGTTLTTNQTRSYSKTQSNGTTEASTISYSYTLNDGDAFDYLSLDIKKPRSGTGAVFSVRGGQTMCPYEGAELTEYFQPGTTISEATMQREIPVISVQNPIQVNVNEDIAAVYNVQLANISESGDDQWFMLKVDEQSNQLGALIEMDGSPIGNGRTILIPAGQTVNKIVTVKKIVPAEYDYEDLGLILHSMCQFAGGTSNFTDIADTAKITANFQRVCSSVTLNNPINQWIVNTNGDTTLTVDISGYNLQHATLDRLAFQYKAASTSLWTTGMLYYMNEDDYNNASEPKTLIDGAPSLSYVFNMKDLQDRNYDIRARSFCLDNTVNQSVVASGIKDVKRPRVFGTPQPGSGILNPGDNVMVTFDEEIQAGALTPYNFTVKGVLNGTPLQHESAVFFDGSSSYASVARGVNLNEKSFTITLWSKRTSFEPGVLFSQADLEIGYSASGKIYLKAGQQEVLSNSTFPVLDQWNFIVAKYDFEADAFSLFVNSIQEAEDVARSSVFNGDGRMFIGKSYSGTKFYTGYIHNLRIWDQALGFGAAYAGRFESMSGSEKGLLACYPMNETIGDLAIDISRSNHLRLFNTQWAVFPTGYAREFNGSNEVLNMPSASSVLITRNMDFTLEFYFKANPQSNTVIFSNGNDTGSDLLPALENIWVVGFNANGKLYAKNNGTSITLADFDVTDGKWHHFALVCNRLANTSIFIDGNMRNFAQSSAFGGLMGPEIAFGARRNQQSADLANVFYDRYFNGKLDELRIWGLNRTKNQIDLTIASKLSGDEMGLLAYYPFENINNFGVISPDLLDNVTGELVATEIGGSSTNTDVPSIKGARPVQDIAFDWVVNTDKIIINITEQPALIEKTILEFTVDRVEDLRENRIASPVTWSAYINQNTMIWEEQVLDYEKELYEPLSFSTVIKNTGGTVENYEISNLPAWLTTSNATGSVNPLGQRTINFTVNEALNIGDHTVSLYLTSDFGFSEKIDITVHVTVPSPEWNVDVSNYEYSCNITGQLYIDSTISINSNDLVSAFIDGELRGVGKLTYIPSYDTYMVFLDIYSNNQYGDSIEFKVWDASTGKIINRVSPTLVFESNAIYGQPWNPIGIYASDYYEARLPLRNGWSWVSFNLASPDLNDLPTLFNTVTLSDNNIIKNQVGYDIYSSQANQWFGGLTSNNNVTNNSMYMIRVSQLDTLVYNGPKADVSVPVDVVAGWNWIGYKPQVAMTVEEALTTFQPSQGDVVKNQTQFAMYDPNLGWIGSLTMMRPHQGYMYRAAQAGQIIYPEESSMSRSNDDIEVQQTQWNVTPYQFERTMTVFAQIKKDNVIDNTNYILGAFVGDECRGAVEASYINGNNYYFLSLSSDETEDISFKLYNPENNAMYDAVEKLVFIGDKIEGELHNPFVINLNESVMSITPTINFGLMSVYPNPFDENFTIELEKPISSGAKVYITDILGKEIYHFPANLVEGKTKLTWDVKLSNGSEIPKGVYHVHIKAREFNEIISIVKK
jgi:hypothetical protein